MGILVTLLEDLSRELTIADLAKSLGQKYPQAFRTVKGLAKKGLITLKAIGKSRVVQLDFMRSHPEYSQAELERLSGRLSDKTLVGVYENLTKMHTQPPMVLFGSYAAGKATKASDIDILAIIPKESNPESIEKSIRQSAPAYPLDVNAIAEDSLFEMWAHPQKLSVGNEILKNHICLFGADIFITLLRKRYAGR
ncbi:nucleotidyltransferase domain-containing protein [Candidatus Woesearchaeota archaeon]|nr:nucleotidyltransferase domain-containing protein [Candidatus Woesearchaeota archaeon]